MMLTRFSLNGILKRKGNIMLLTPGLARFAGGSTNNYNNSKASDKEEPILFWGCFIVFGIGFLICWLGIMATILFVYIL